MELCKSYTKIPQLFEKICYSDSDNVKILVSLLNVIDIRDLDDETIATGIVYALAKDNIFVLDWLLKKDRLIIKEDIFDAAIDSNNTRPLDWFVEHGLLKTEYFDYMVNYAFIASTNKKKMLDWFLAHGYNFDTDAYYKGISAMLMYEFYQQGLFWLLEKGYITRLIRTYYNSSNKYLVNIHSNKKRKLETWIKENYKNIIDI